MERMDAGKSIPLLREVRGAVGEDAVPPGPLKARENVHPLQEALLEHDSTRQQFRELSRDAAFGSHFEMRLRMEQHMVGGAMRLPSLPTSFVALETLQNKDSKLCFEDIFQDPELSTAPQPSVHTLMEQRLGI